MRLAADDAPVAVKRRAVEPINKVKILPVFLWSMRYLFSIVKDVNFVVSMAVK
jgi:hypothetical protein